MTKAQKMQLKSKSGKTIRTKKPNGKKDKILSDSSSLESFFEKIDKAFEKRNRLVELPIKTKPVLTGKEKPNGNKIIQTKHLSFEIQVELESKLGSAQKGMLLLASMTTDWDVQTLELKKLIQLVKEGIPKSIGIKRSQGRAKFDSAHAWVTRNSRAKTWLAIQNATWETCQEFPETSNAARTLIKRIKQLLEPRDKQDSQKNGLSWVSCLIEKPPKWGEFDCY